MSKSLISLKPWFRPSDHLEERIKEVELKQKVLTEQEKRLEKMATEKDWAEVDKDSNK